METEVAIRLEGITKRFGKVVANNKIDMDLRRGEILALLGENGSGKTTLMNMLSGIYFPDEGKIFVDGKEVTIRSPKDSFDLGIAMIHQHFKLVEVLTASENIILGLKGGGTLDRKKVSEDIRAISEKYGFDIDPDRKIYDMGVSEKQTVEIVKALYRGAQILILDEPTAVLTPQETDKLFAVLRNMKADGKAIIIITHKLHEVMAISDEVSVLRKGQYIGTVQTAEMDPQKLTDMMVGHAVSLDIDRPTSEHRNVRLKAEHLTVISDEGVTVLNDVSFDAFGGEVLGIAGVAGSGQKELLEAIAGLQKTEKGGSVRYFPPDDEEPIAGSHAPVNPDGEELLGKTPIQIEKIGVSLAFVPEDRLGMGLVAGMDMVGNMMLKTYKDSKGPFVDRKPPRELAERLITELEIVTPGVTTPVRRLSGGNVQKVLVGREIASSPTVLMTAYPVRGLDINSSYTIYHLLNEQKMKGVAVMMVGEDLDVLLELCDRILVLCGGKLSAILDGPTTTKEEVGLCMTHLREGKGESVCTQSTQHP
ncbi:MAG: ABC transporter ATP-binding protein [Oscillospiraceae bacterium]